MSTKRFYIRRSQQELMAEQTKLLETFLTSREGGQGLQHYWSDPNRQHEAVTKPELEFVYDDDDAPFIPMLTMPSNSTSSISISSSKSKIDDESVAKLKKIRADSTKNV